MERILIIEDDLNLQESIVYLLEQEGFRCLSASDGHDGIDIARKEMPELILCDIKMPGISGHQVLTELRRDSRTSSIPFIFLTALIDSHEVRKGMNLGADDYITKPFENDELISAIRTRLSKSQEISERFQKLRKEISNKLPHELLTPIVSIVGYSELLIERFRNEKDSVASDYSKQIYDAGLRLNKMIQNFLVFTRLKLAESENDRNFTKLVEPTLVSFSFVKSIAENTAAKYLRKEDLVINGTDGIINISLNDFNILLEELLDNAFKFSGPGDKVQVELEEKKGEYIILIRNAGRGMTDEQLKKIDAYVQFDREIYEQQGIGLGLIISKKLAELYGGSFELKSKSNESTEVLIKFPSVRENENSLFK